MFKVGLSECGKGFADELFADYAASGIFAMEISLIYEEYCELNYEAVAEKAKRHGVELWSLHLPFSAELDVSDKRIADRTVSVHEKIIENGARIGIKTFILHPSAEPIEEGDRAERMALSKKNLAHLADFAAKRGARIAVENLPRTCLGRNSEEMLELLSADERLCACFDTNHLLKEDSVKFIKALGKNIVTTHVSDYDFINERHWMPGEGKLDWQAILGALKDVGYCGPWIYEINFEAPKTIIRPRDFCCRDFKKNADEIFSGAPLTVLGTPKENLGMWG